jgi:hypothetical protein
MIDEGRTQIPDASSLPGKLIGPTHKAMCTLEGRLVEVLDSRVLGHDNGSISGLQLVDQLRSCEVNGDIE